MFIVGSGMLEHIYGSSCSSDHKMTNLIAREVLNRYNSIMYNTIGYL